MNYLHLFKKGLLLFGCTLFFSSVSINTVQGADIGVIFILHGGMDTYEEQYLWDAAVHQFTYDPNHFTSTAC